MEELKAIEKEMLKEEHKSVKLAILGKTALKASEEI